MRAFTVNVGINTSPDYLGRSAPIYANGTFQYHPRTDGILHTMN
jgi:hypothetical protein